MEQLFLDLKQIRPLVPSFDNFSVGENHQILAAVRACALGQPLQPVLFIFGPEGSGCTHLLKAAASYPNNAYVDAAKDPTLASIPIEQESQFTMIAVDNVDRLAEDGQQRVFHLCNQARIGKSCVLAGANIPPRALQLRDDLRLRLMQGLAYAITPLTDEQKLSALKSHVAARQMAMDEDTIQYLLTHAGRDLGTLIRLLDLIDHISLKKKQRPSIALVREIIQSLPENQPVSITMQPHTSDTSLSNHGRH